MFFFVLLSFSLSYCLYALLWSLHNKSFHSNPELSVVGYPFFVLFQSFHISVEIPHLLIYFMKKVKVLVAQSCLTVCDPMDCSPLGSSVHGILHATILEWVSHSFLQGIFPTQGLNPGLLHCRQILYCLSHQGSPKYFIYSFKYFDIF